MGGTVLVFEVRRVEKHALTREHISSKRRDIGAAGKPVELVGPRIILLESLPE